MRPCALFQTTKPRCPVTAATGEGHSSCDENGQEILEGATLAKTFPLRKLAEILHDLESRENKTLNTQKGG